MQLSYHLNNNFRDPNLKLVLENLIHSNLKDSESKYKIRIFILYRIFVRKLDRLAFERTDILTIIVEEKKRKKRREGRTL